MQRYFHINFGRLYARDNESHRFPNLLMAMGFSSNSPCLARSVFDSFDPCEVVEEDLYPGFWPLDYSGDEEEVLCSPPSTARGAMEIPPFFSHPQPFPDPPALAMLIQVKEEGVFPYSGDIRLPIKEELTANSSAPFQLGSCETHPYLCPVEDCGHRYRRKGDLKTHVLKRHHDRDLAAIISKPRSTKEGKTFPCPVDNCKSGYSRNRELLRHFRLKHMHLYVRAVEERERRTTPDSSASSSEELESRESSDDLDLQCSEGL